MTFRQALKIARSLGDVAESTSYGTPAIKIDGQLVARLKEDGDSLVVGISYEERAEMMDSEPEIYYITDHYLNAPWVLVRLSKVHPDALRDLLGGAMKIASAAAARKKAARRRK